MEKSHPSFSQIGNSVWLVILRWILFLKPLPPYFSMLFSAPDKAPEAATSDLDSARELSPERPTPDVYAAARNKYKINTAATSLTCCHSNQ